MLIGTPICFPFTVKGSSWLAMILGDSASGNPVRSITLPVWTREAAKEPLQEKKTSGALAEPTVTRTLSL